MHLPEIAPPDIRGRALALSACLSWVGLAAFFLLLDVLNVPAVFHAIPYLDVAVICAVINIGTAVFVYLSGSKNEAAISVSLYEFRSCPVKLSLLQFRLSQQGLKCNVLCSRALHRT